MSDLMVAASFSKNSGQPATGLTLSEISFYLTQVNRATGAESVIWDGTQNPTSEIDNVGTYIRILTTANLDLYNYFALAQYTGATSLDTDYVSGAISLNNIPVGTAREVTYPVTDSVTGAGIEGVEVWIYTDSGATTLAWYGTTDANGVARDIYDHLPRLDTGVYYVKVQRIGYLPDETLDTLTVI